jgi:hypothetical protein
VTTEISRACARAREETFAGPARSPSENLELLGSLAAPEKHDELQQAADDDVWG